MEIQKIVNVLNDSDNEPSKFATKKWYVIHDENGSDYGEGKFEKNYRINSVRLFRCIYSCNG